MQIKLKRLVDTMGSNLRTSRRSLYDMSVSYTAPVGKAVAAAGIDEAKTKASAAPPSTSVNQPTFDGFHGPVACAGRWAARW
jgi:hypothetical protein